MEFLTKYLQWSINMSKINLKNLIVEVSKEKISGGKASKLSIEDIAKKHGVDVSVIKSQLKIGIKIEMEHTTDPKIAREIAMDHLSEFSNYYTKLRKMEKEMSESNLTFKKYMTLFETSLEDMSAYDEDDTEDNIELLHEMEYKLSKIIKDRWAVHPKLFKNILIRFSNIALQIYNNLEPKFTEALQYWSNMHKIEDADDFSDMIVTEYEDGIGPYWANEVYKHGLRRGNVSISAKELKDSISTDTIFNMLHDASMSGDDIVELYQYAAKSFLDDNNIEIPENIDENSDNYYDDEEEIAAKYISDHNMEIDFMKYLADTYSAEDLFGDTPQNEDVIIGIIKTRLYDDYMANFGSAIESIKDEISEHNERVSNFDSSIVEQYIETLQNTDPSDDSIEEIGNTLYTNGIAPMARIISLAMNIDHVSGNIAADYGGDMLKIRRDFYDIMHKRDTADWDEELKSIIKPKRI